MLGEAGALFRGAGGAGGLFGGLVPFHRFGAADEGVGEDVADKLVSVAERARNLKGHGLDEGISTRMLVYAATLIGKNVAPLAACRMALVRPITDDPDMRDALDSAVTTFF